MISLIAIYIETILFLAWERERGGNQKVERLIVCSGMQTFGKFIQLSVE